MKGAPAGRQRSARGRGRGSRFRPCVPSLLLRPSPRSLLQCSFSLLWHETRPAAREIDGGKVFHLISIEALSARPSNLHLHYGCEEIQLVEGRPASRLHILCRVQEHR